MNKRQSRYKKMEFLMTIVLCLDVAIFLAYLIFAGAGMVALKVTAAFLCFVVSGAALAFLYMTRELLRRRSIWMSLAAACLLLCLIVSLVLKFPAPPYSLPVV